MIIKNIPTKQLAAIVAGLVKEGIVFEAQPDELTYDHWLIKLTGGY